MRFALSTNWNNRHWAAHRDGSPYQDNGATGRANRPGEPLDGAAIADEAIALGFDALELGFRTTSEQVAGIRSRLDQMPVDSVHAYCPVPIGAPDGHPELHQLAHPDETERALARLLMRRTIACAAELGAKVVVVHAGYVDLDGFFVNCNVDALRHLLRDKDGKEDVTRPVYRRHLAKALARRRRRGPKTLECFRRSFDDLLPDLEKAGVTLALENLPSIQAFPDADEAERLMKEYAGAPLRLWFDTGHARVCESHLWGPPVTELAARLAPHVCGIHLNDVRDFHDDHRQPGWGGVDFAALRDLANRDVLRVFEPHEPVSFDEIRTSLERIRDLWTK